MASKVHKAKVIQRPDRTITTTLCNRLSNRNADGINSTDVVADVTCKLCLAQLATTPSVSA